MLQDFYFSSIQGLVSVLFHLYPAMMSFMIFFSIFYLTLWSFLFIKIMKQYDFESYWLSFIPFGKFYFRLKVKKRPIWILIAPILELISAVVLYFMPFSILMAVPGSILFFSSLLKWSMIVFIDKKIWQDFKLSGTLFYLVFLPIIGPVFYIGMMVKIAFSPELYYEYEEDDISEWN